MNADSQWERVAADAFRQADVKATKTGICRVSVNVRVHFVELDPVFAVFSEHFHQIVGYRIAALIACMNHELLPTLHLLAGQMKKVAEKRLDRSRSYRCFFAGIDEHLF